jgi:hypothetical protein
LHSSHPLPNYRFKHFINHSLYLQELNGNYDKEDTTYALNESFKDLKMIADYLRIKAPVENINDANFDKYMNTVLKQRHQIKDELDKYIAQVSVNFKF